MDWKMISLGFDEFAEVHEPVNEPRPGDCLPDVERYTRGIQPEYSAPHFRRRRTLQDRPRRSSSRKIPDSSPHTHRWCACGRIVSEAGVNRVDCKSLTLLRTSSGIELNLTA